MGKKNKKGLSDKIRNNRKATTKALTNPFEVKVNKVKRNVVNRKIQKGEKGLPGVSRSKALKKRKDTLLTELHHSKKSNTLHDKRFGERDSSMTADDKMIHRFALERKNQMNNKTNMFNLNMEEEVLTHYGQSLGENLRDRVDSDSDGDDRDKGTMKTGHLQFGGFSKEEEPSWKDKMMEVIADSKKQKYERQAEKEKSIEATKELDLSWKTVVSSIKTAKAYEPAKKRMSDFFQLSRALAMEKKTEGASDKLKTEEEKAKDEAETLQMLEVQRLERMIGDTKKSKSNHVSADSLSSQFDLSAKKKVTFSEPAIDESDEDDIGESDEDDSGESDENDDEQEESEDSQGSGSEDANSDLESENSDHEEDVNENGNLTESEKGTSESQKTEKTPTVKDSKSTGDLPFVYQAPGSYDELKSLLHGHSAEEQMTIISRLRKCHHPSLADGNKEKLENIHLFLLEYFGELAWQQTVDSKLLNHMTKDLWEMSQMFPVSTAKAMQQILIGMQKHFDEIVDRRGGRGTFCSLDSLMYLNLVSILFPTSDFRHPVATPAIIVITQMLSESSVRNYKDVVSGLFLVALALKYVSLSKRFVPEAVTFVHGILFLASDKKSKSEFVFPPFRMAGKETCNLEVQKACDEDVSQLPLFKLMKEEPEELKTDKFRCDVINCCLDLLEHMNSLWQELVCLDKIMKPVKKQLQCLPISRYPTSVQEKLESLLGKLENANQPKLKVMQQESKKPEPLRLFEPKLESFWSGKHKKGGSDRAVNEHQRLTHKHKREMKAAVREIKRDNEVLARHQLDEVLQKDAERKRKTRELLGDLASQEGDYKAIKRLKFK